MSLLQPGEADPVILVNEGGSSRVVLVCEHAGRVVPRALGNLGLGEADLSRHIAWDIGAEAVSRRLSQKLDATLILQRYTRLAYDCNRPPESPGAIPEVSELTASPGNRKLPAEDRLARAREIYRPFHDGVSLVLDRRAAAGRQALIVSIHSFTPVYKGKPRSVELGILHDRDTALSAKLIKSFPNIDARLNEPYGPKDGVLHTLNMHGFARGLQHVGKANLEELIEVRGHDADIAQPLEQRHDGMGGGRARMQHDDRQRGVLGAGFAEMHLAIRRFEKAARDLCHRIVLAPCASARLYIVVWSAPCGQPTRSRKPR